MLSTKSIGHKSVDANCAEIDRYSSRDAEKYREFIDFWQRLLHGIIPIFNALPKSVIDNEAILKIDCALSEPLRFDRHEHRYEFGANALFPTLKHTVLGRGKQDSRYKDRSNCRMKYFLERQALCQTTYRY